MALDFAVQGASCDLKPPGRLMYVPAGLIQDFLNQCPFVFGQGFSLGGFGFALNEEVRKVLFLNHPLSGQDQCMVYRVFKLANIARPFKPDK